MFQHRRCFSAVIRMEGIKTELPKCERRKEISRFSIVPEKQNLDAIKLNRENMKVMEEAFAHACEYESFDDSDELLY